MTLTRGGSIPPGWRTCPEMFGSQVLFDIAYVARSVHDTRIDGGGNRLATVEPAIGFTDPDGRRDARDRRSTGARGWHRCAVCRLHRYVDDGPQRYASVSLCIHGGHGRRGVPSDRPVAHRRDYIAPQWIDRTTIYDVARSATLGLALQAPSRVGHWHVHHPVAEISILRRSARGRLRVGTVIHAPRSDSRRGRAAAHRRGESSSARSPGDRRRHGHQRMLGAGDSRETAPAPTGYVSVLTVDSAKRLLGIGFVRAL